MKYDKYGDPIVEGEKKLSGKRLRSILIMFAIMVVLIALNFTIAFAGILHEIVCFILAPFYLLVFVSINKGTTALAEEGFNTKKINVINIALLIVYVVSVFVGFFG